MCFICTEWWQGCLAFLDKLLFLGVFWHCGASGNIRWALPFLDPFAHNCFSVICSTFRPIEPLWTHFHRNGYVELSTLVLEIKAWKTKKPLLIGLNEIWHWNRRLSAFFFRLFTGCQKEMLSPTFQLIVDGLRSSVGGCFMLLWTRGEKDPSRNVGV
jgi:hypothetical protein